MPCPKCLPDDLCAVCMHKELQYDFKYETRRQIKELQKRIEQLERVVENQHNAHPTGPVLFF